MRERFAVPMLVLLFFPAVMLIFPQARQSERRRSMIEKLRGGNSSWLRKVRAFSGGGGLRLCRFKTALCTRIKVA